MDTQTVINTEIVENMPEKPGEKLRRIREELGLTSEEVAIHLHLSPNMIDALEMEQLEKLPSMVFIRGYLRAYAKLLNIPADDLVLSFNAMYPHDMHEKGVSLDRNYQHIVIKHKRRRESSVKWIGYAIILIMIILVATWWHSRSNSGNFTFAHLGNTGSFQTPTSEQKSVVSTDSVQTPVANAASVIPMVGAGDNAQTQMEVTHPLAAGVANTVSNTPGLQPDPNLPPSMAANAASKTLDVTQITANAAAVPGLSSNPASNPTSASNVQNTNTAATQQISSWRNPDSNE